MSRNPLSALNIMLVENQAAMVKKIESLLSDPKSRYPHQVKIRVFGTLTDAKKLLSRSGMGRHYSLFGLTRFKRLSDISTSVCGCGSYSNNCYREKFQS